MLFQQGVPVGFSDKNDNYWCAIKGVMCPSASVWGQCSKTACSYIENNTKSLPDTAGISLPDNLVINGVLYRRVTE